MVYIAVMGAQEADRGTFDLSLIDLGTVTDTCTNINPSVTDAEASSNTNTPETVSEPVGGDLQQDLNTTGYIQPNGNPATGQADRSTDYDWFRVPLIAGFRYTVEMTGNQPPDYGGTLENPLVHLLTPDGEPIQINSTYIRSYTGDLTTFVGDNDSGAGLNAKVKSGSTSPIPTSSKPAAPPPHQAKPTPWWSPGAERIMIPASSNGDQPGLPSTSSEHVNHSRRRPPPSSGRPHL